MLENRQYTPEQDKQSQWELFNNLPDRDYWVGIDYVGINRDRLELHLPAMEKVCRALNLPPIQIRSGAWNPPAEMEPEMAGPNLIAWKKIGFPTFSNKLDEPLYTLDALTPIEILPDSYEDDGLPSLVPIGWQISIKDRKIERDFVRNKPHVDKKEEDRNFITKFNSAIWSGVADIAFKEMDGNRDIVNIPNDSEISTRFGVQILEILSMLGGNVIARVQDPHFIEYILESLAISTPITWTGSHFILEKNYRGEKELKDRGKILAAVSNAWRKQEFPDRFKSEVHGLNTAQRRMIQAIPYVGIVLEPVICRYIMKEVIRWDGAYPLVRLREE